MTRAEYRKLLQTAWTHWTRLELRLAHLMVAEQYALVDRMDLPFGGLMTEQQRAALFHLLAPIPDQVLVDTQSGFRYLVFSDHSVYGPLEGNPRAFHRADYERSSSH